METPAPSEQPPKTLNSSEEEEEDDLTTTQKWCDLPQEILYRIIRHLDWNIDIPRLRGVCPSWRSALPLNELPDTPSRFKVPPMEDEQPLILVEGRFDLMGSLLPDFNGGRKWLARTFEIGPNKWHLLNPLNFHEYFLVSPSITGSFNLLDCRVEKLSPVFCLISTKKSKPVSKKVVGGWNFSSSYLFAVLVQLGGEYGGEGGGLFLWRLRDEEWSKIEGSDDVNILRVFDIAFYNGKFYVFDLSKWRIGVIDPTNFSIEMEFFPAPDILADPIDGNFTVKLDGQLYFFQGSFLVSSNGGLYLVIQSRPMKSSKVIMFIFLLKEEEKEQKWERITNLGDQILFIGQDVSFSLARSSENLPEWKPNSICLFSRPFPLFFDGYMKGCGEAPNGVECLDFINYAEHYRYFDMFEVDQEEKGVVSFGDLPMEVYTGLFFPPPPWIKWHCPSRDNAEVKVDGLKFRKDNDDGDDDDDDDDNEVGCVGGGGGDDEDNDDDDGGDDGDEDGHSHGDVEGDGDEDEDED